MQEYNMNMDAARKNAVKVTNEERDSSGSSDITFYNLDVGEHLLRFLPPWSQELAESGGIDITVYYHYNLPVDPASDRTFLKLCCPAKTFPKENIPCDICKVLNNIYTNSKQDIKRLWARGKFFTNVLPRSTDSKVDLSESGFYQEQDHWVNKDNKVFVMSYPITVHRWLIKTLVSPMVGNFVSVKDGVDISITRTGKLMKTEYMMGNAAFKSPIHQDQSVIDQVMGNMTNLNEIFRLPDDAYLESIKNTSIRVADKYPVDLAKHVVPDRPNMISPTLSISSEQSQTPLVPEEKPDIKCTDGEDSFGKYRKEVACTSCLQELECIGASPEELKPFSGK